MKENSYHNLVLLERVCQSVSEVCCTFTSIWCGQTFGVVVESVSVCERKLIHLTCVNTIISILKSVSRSLKVQSKCHQSSIESGDGMNTNELMYACLFVHNPLFVYVYAVY